MRSPYPLVWATTCCLLPLAALAGQFLDTESGATRTNITRSLSNQSIAFTKNLGQWPDSILFRASAGGTTMWFTKDGIWYQFTKHIQKNATGEEALAAGLGPRRPNMPGKFGHEPDSLETGMVKAFFIGVDPKAEVVGSEEQAYKCNYFLGNDPSKWHTDVPNYSAATFTEIYPGIKVTFRGNDGKLEYELHGRADAVAKAQAAYVGGKATTASDGLARVQTKLGEKTFQGLLPVTGASPVTTALVPASPQRNVTLLYSTSEELSKIRKMSPASWNYKGNDPSKFRHCGPVAKEFFAAFGRDGVGQSGDSVSINSGDQAGILMIAVQALD